MRHAAVRRTALVAGFAVAVLLGVLRPGALPQEQDPAAKARIKEAQALVRVVYAALRGRLDPAERPFRWSNDFFKGQGGHTYVPFTLTVERSAIPTSGVATYLLVTARRDPAAKPIEPTLDHLAPEEISGPPLPDVAFEAAYFLNLNPDQPSDLYRVSRAVSLPPGDYDVYVALAASSATEAATPDPLTLPVAPASPSTREAPLPRAAAPRLADSLVAAAAGAPAEKGTERKVLMIKQELSVPNLWTGELSTSTIVVADRVDPLDAPVTPEQQASDPYVLGTVRIVPAAGTDFQKSDQLSVVFFVYNPGLTAERKPNITVEYLFHQRTAQGERYFSRTTPQNFNAQTLPGFDIDAGHQLVAGQAIPLQMFPVGTYRLEIKVTDNTRATTVTRSVHFTVRAS